MIGMINLALCALGALVLQTPPRTPNVQPTQPPAASGAATPACPAPAGPQGTAAPAQSPPAASAGPRSGQTCQLNCASGYGRQASPPARSPDCPPAPAGRNHHPYGYVTPN
jgi:hypothetical protein